MTATLITLPIRPQMDFDATVLADLCARHGDRAEAHLAGVLGDIECHLSLAELQSNQAHTEGLRRTCTDLTVLAAEVGMRSLGRATSAVLHCLENRDTVALAACVTRLIAMGRPDVFRDWSTFEGNTVA